MNHPHELLADLVDGTLDEGDLAGVQAHLSVCVACREDVAHATAARDAARSLPRAAAPPDLHARVVAAAGGRGHGVPTPGVPAWYRWAGVAAAAAVVVAIAISLPNIGTEDDTPRGAEDAAAPVGAAETDAGGSQSGVTVEVQDRDYDGQDLERLAADAPPRAGSIEAEGGTRDASPAVRCVTRATRNNATGRLTRLIQARFEGRAAYIAIYLEAAAADQPGLVAVWAAARDGCSLLSTAYSRR